MLLEIEAQSFIQTRQACNTSYILSLWFLKIKSPVDLHCGIFLPLPSKRWNSRQAPPHSASKTLSATFVSHC